MRWLERRIILDVVDSQWKVHLLSLDHLKEGIGLRGYGQKDPLVEFKKEAFTLFEDMMARIDNETVRYLFHIQVQQGEPPQQLEQRPEPPRPPRQDARSAMASAAARASLGNDPDLQQSTPQHLPSVAREIERKLGSSATCSIKPGRRKPKPPSPFAPPRKWVATIRVPADQERNIRSVTARTSDSHVPARRFIVTSVVLNSNSFSQRKSNQRIK
jgi:hypothetical protein